MPKVIAIVDDLFFASKIRGTAEALSVPVSFPRKLESLIESANSELPQLIICDLNATRIDPIALSETLKADDGLRSIPLIGFFSHVDTELQQRALEAGFDRVLPRSVFTRDLPRILSGETGETIS
jgi:CheY-like chemotaxis protein